MWRRYTVSIDKYKQRTSKLKYILISHLHGDHFFGLPGLLTSMNLLGHSQPIYLFGPPALKEILDLVFKAGQTHLNFDLIFTPIGSGYQKQLVDVPELEINCFQLYHRIPTMGFKIISKPLERNIIPFQYRKV